MNIIYQSALGQSNPHLFPAFKKTFAEQGHTETTNPHEATHLFLDGIGGDTDYDHVIFDIVLKRKLPIVYFDCSEYGPLYKEEEAFTDHELFTTHAIVNGNPTVCFMRNMSKIKHYADFVYPYDWPYFQECDYPLTTQDELFNRPYDITFVGTVSPTRENVINGLLKDGRLKINFQDRDHSKRFSNYQDWVAEHRKAKLYLSCDGAGFTNERPLQLFSVAAQLRVRNNHLAERPMEDCISCLEIDERPTKEDIDKVIDIINDKGWLWDIYNGGYEHTKKYYSHEARANYVLDKIKRLL